MGLVQGGGDQTAKTGSSASTSSTRGAASARPRRPSSTPARCTASSRPATSTRSTTRSSRSCMRGIAENAFLSKWAGGLGGSWTVGARHRRLHPGHQRREPGRHPVPQAAQRPARGGEPGRQAPRLRLRLPRDLAQRHRGLPRAAQEHRRRAPPHPRHEHRELDSRPVHEAHGGARALDPVPRQRVPRPPRPLRQGLRGALPSNTRSWPRRARSGREQVPAIELWKRMLQDALRDRPPVDHLQGSLQRPQPAGPLPASSTRSNLCTEITLNTSDEETAVCNLGSVVLDTHLTTDGDARPRDAARRPSRVAIRALDNVIDINFYPTEAAKTANSRHRPIGLGVMGLQNALYKRGLRLRLRGGRRVQRRVHGGHRLLRLRGLQRPRRPSAAPTRTYKGSKWDRGLLPQDTLDLLEDERGSRSTSRAAARWTGRRCARRSPSRACATRNVLAIAPTATISNIMGTTPCIEPTYKNLFVKSNLSGDFIVLNRDLVRDLKKRRPLEPGHARPAQVLRRRARRHRRHPGRPQGRSTSPSSGSASSASSTPPPGARSGSTRPSR